MSNGVRLSKLHTGNYRKTISANCTSACVYFPNLMVGEQRDILIESDLPSVTSSQEIFEIFSSSLVYSPIATRDKVTVTGQDCVISRVLEADKNMERNNAVDVQINRTLLDKATTTSLALADEGNYKKACSNLTATLNDMKVSSSAIRRDHKTLAFISEL